jgi:hypothetical protein
MTSHAALIRQIIEIGFQFNNADSVAAEFAATNILAGKPAFWSSASGGHAAIGSLIHEANALGSLSKGIASCDAISGRRHDHGKVEWLDKLIPLNGVAVADLLDAYAARKTFRSARELFERADRVGFAMVEAAA